MALGALGRRAAHDRVQKHPQISDRRDPARFRSSLALRTQAATISSRGQDVRPGARRRLLDATQLDGFRLAVAVQRANVSLLTRTRSCRRRSVVDTPAEHVRRVQQALLADDHIDLGVPRRNTCSSCRTRSMAAMVSSARHSDSVRSLHGAAVRGSGGGNSPRRPGARSRRTRAEGSALRRALQRRRTVLDRKVTREVLRNCMRCRCGGTVRQLLRNSGRSALPMICGADALRPARISCCSEE